MTQLLGGHATAITNEADIHAIKMQLLAHQDNLGK